MADIAKLEKLAKLVRYYILRMTTKAGSGHPTSSLSATDLMVALFFNHLRFDLENPQNSANDRVIFSKGHASPLLYALYAAAGVLTEKELDGYRKFESPLEGHPTPRFKYVDVATGSLGQGLSIGLGMALAMRISGPVSGFPPASAKASVGKPASDDSAAVPLEAKRSGVGNPPTTATRNSQARDTRDTLPKVYVLMGDSETSEGSVWEAVELASYYKLGNLVGIIDINRLGQSGQTMLGWDVDKYKERIEAFGWQTHLVDGHDLRSIVRTLDLLPDGSSQPQMIIAKTIKGKGVSFLEDKEGWHGKALSEEQFKEAVKELGEIDFEIKSEIKKPTTEKFKIQPVLDRVETRSGNSKFKITNQKLKVNYQLGEMVPTRKAYGEALVALGEIDPRIVSLDAEVKNSTYSELFKEKYPERFFEMFIAEQNMVGVALGLSKRGKIPFVSTFAAFLSRAADQIRISAISGANIKFVGSHAGVSIGEDGPSQMGLEDLAMFRSIFGSTILYPADAVSCVRLVALAAENQGIFYIRTNRPATPVIYDQKEEFKIGGSKVVRSSKDDKLTIVACGVTLIETIKACDELAKKGIRVRVIDAYSIKPIDEKTLKKSAQQTNNLIITVEDHYFDGGLGDAVLNVFAQSGKVKIYKLAVGKLPMSGKPDQLLDWEGISASSIINKVREILG
ncbi:hypothetical protein A2W45_01840 [Candidatus Curtissbacteria bacterium RIFCSPHIGHO2_12_41_11]|uniref:Transketolase-like pyrimidine-binding domain-containing protein n=2 Tax=Candidatus Curtissiibacteriota TaxID=1752717 RepID=A0A1F5HTQ9_9BACT|nr:MAG: hypothetical protein A2W45_01840 [Candidatus Curtissbacteria bacterium RIFCSPHIGHO2_12_41_11]OGE07399.1 MAG: hypothetical protein A2W70_03340 [Candidatus Curtissbacteria bacterium RIFCSPLOWO2_02_41_11]